MTLFILNSTKNSLEKKFALEIITSYVHNVLLGGLGHEYSC